MSLAVQAAVHIGKRVYSCSLEVRVNNFALPKASLSGSAQASFEGTALVQYATVRHDSKSFFKVSSS